MTSRFLLYFHTIRYLKFRQIYFRVLRYFTYSSPKIKALKKLRRAEGEWLLPAQKNPSIQGEDTFLFLNKIGRLSEIKWEGPEQAKLWRYNQHYFDDLSAKDFSTRLLWHEGLMKKWIDENPPGASVGWEPYPTSLRIVNWIKWHQSGHLLSDECLNSLFAQGQWLNKRVEWHILGNHIFANAKALIFAGVLFECKEAEKLLKRGLSIISDQFPEQILKDGSHFERSPMYHSIILEDILDLINLAGTYPSAIPKEHSREWRLRVPQMIDWLNGMCHPDGGISFFNDSAMGIGSAPKEIRDYSTRLGIPPRISTHQPRGISMTRFSESGYVRLSGPNVVAILDVAPLGPDYLLGHAHADSLSFETSLFEKRVFVNSGTSQYENDSVRTEERGTASHNTVEIDSQNSSEIWSTFRVARRAYPIDLEINQNEESILITCGHDGYYRLPGRPIHKRSWTFTSSSLLIRDWVEGEFQSGVARLHLHPNIRVSTFDGIAWTLQLPDTSAQVELHILSGDAEIEESFYAPEFGKRIVNQCLKICFKSGQVAAAKLTWDTHKLK